MAEMGGETPEQEGRAMNVAPRIEAYLAGPRYTLWTFIKYFERSGDPAHARRLKRAMEAELKHLHAEGKVVRCRSVKGGRSWYRKCSDVPF